MKTRKWFWWTLGILGTFVLLAGAGFAGYQIGFRQSIMFADSDTARPFVFSHMRGAGDEFRFHPDMHGDGPQFQQGHRFGMNQRGFSHGGGFFLFPSFFGLIRLVFWALIIWLAYTLFTRSGWRLIRESPPIVEMAEEKKPRDA